MSNIDLKRVRLILTIGTETERNVPYPYNDMTIDSIMRQSRRKAEPGTYCRRKKVTSFWIRMYIDNILIASFGPSYEGHWSEDITPTWDASRFVDWLDCSTIKDLSLSEALGEVLKQAEAADKQVAYWPVVWTQKEGWRLSRCFGQHKMPFADPEETMKWLDEKHFETGIVFKAVKGTLLSPGVEYIPKIAK